MNKNLWLALAFLFIGQGVATHVKASDLGQNRLRGSVKSLESVEYTPKRVGIHWEPGAVNLKTIRVFDSEGKMIEETLKDGNNHSLFLTKIGFVGSTKNVEYTSFKDNGEVDYKESGKLKLDGEVLNMKTLDAKGNLKSSVKSKFDAEGKLINTTSYDANENSTCSRHFGYNSSGRLSFIKIEPKDRVSYVEFYDYSSRGDLIEVKTVDLDGVVLNQLLYTYDADGNRIKTTIYPNLDSNKEHQVTKYNAKGETIESIYYSPTAEVMQKELFTYNSDGRVQKFEVYQSINNVLVNDYTIQYDEFGNEIDRTTFDAKGIPVNNIQISYKYDAQNNWVEKLEKENNETSLITKRTITYY